MGRLFHGDLGTSATNRVSVTTSFLTRFPATIELTIAAMLVSIGFGIPLGIAAAKRQGSIFDNLATVLSLLGISIPIFFLGLLLAYVFGVWLHWLPVFGRYDLAVTRGRDELPAVGVAGDRSQPSQVMTPEAPDPAGHRPRDDPLAHVARIT
jgi:ABC-type dipeptide/oligopeptide/nickel transport system permease component